MNNFKRILALLLCLSFVFCFTGCKKIKAEEKDVTTTTTKAAPSENNPLTGETGFNKDSIGKRPIAITIQNSESRCRPQWGLCSADVVIEGEVEGTATKYLWLFSDVSKVEKAGPFRSVRRDFVELAMGFDAILVHCGWSSGSKIGAYEYISSTGYDHVGNAVTWGKVAPNGKSAGQEYRSYTNTELITSAIEKGKIRKDIKEEYQSPFSFNSKATNLKDGKCSSIAFRIGNNNATFTWKDGAYYGAYSGIDMKDNNGTPYSVANVIVLYLNSIKAVDSKGRVDMDLSEGTGVVASNGTYQEIKWTKGDGKDMIKLFDKDGKEFKLNVGKSYIALARLSNAEKTVISE